MRSLLVATVSAIALLATQALAQSATGQSQEMQQSQPGAESQTPAQAQPGAPAGESAAGGQEQSAAGGQDISQLAASDLMGKKVKLEGKEEAVGEITEVVEADGKPQQVVIDMGTMRETPVAVDISELSQSGEDFSLSMTEEELAQAPAYEAGQQPGATRGVEPPAGQQPTIQTPPGAESGQPGQQSR